MSAASRFFFATRRNWNIRAALTNAVIRPPQTAANRIATPNGRFQCQVKKANGVEAVFWAMKISRTIRTRKPSISDDHSAAALVNLTSDGFAGAGEPPWPDSEPATGV